MAINYHSSLKRDEAIAEKARSTGKKAVCIKGDVSKKSDIAALFEQAMRELGRLDIFMSNSGIEHFGDLETVREDEIDGVFATNVKGQFFMGQPAYSHLRDDGCLILISSASAVMVYLPRCPWMGRTLTSQGFHRHAAYSGFKTAVQGMVKCVAHDFGGRGIAVNCIAPGGVKTDMRTEAAAD